MNWGGGAGSRSTCTCVLGLLHQQTCTRMDNLWVSLWWGVWQLLMLFLRGTVDFINISLWSLQKNVFLCSKFNDVNIVSVPPAAGWLHLHLSRLVQVNVQNISLKCVHNYDDDERFLKTERWSEPERFIQKLKITKLNCLQESKQRGAKSLSSLPGTYQVF